MKSKYTDCPEFSITCSKGACDEFRIWNVLFRRIEIVNIAHADTEIPPKAVPPSSFKYAFAKMTPLASFWIANSIDPFGQALGSDVNPEAIPDSTSMIKERF